MHKRLLGFPWAAIRAGSENGRGLVFVSQERPCEKHLRQQMPMTIEQRFHHQQFANDYALVNGAEMHARYGDRFEIANPWGPVSNLVSASSERLALAALF